MATSTRHDAKTTSFDLRLSEPEKQAFREAAQVAGLPISAWMRERLRVVAIRELGAGGRTAPFIQSIPLGDSNGQDSPQTADSL
jgi:hypothetical protein